MIRSLTARTRVLAAGAALLLTVGALTGCTGRPGQAADMTYTGLDGARHSVVVTEKDIDVVAKEMEPATDPKTGQKRQAPQRVSIVRLLIEAPYLAEVAQAHGITITDAQIVQVAKQELGLEPRQARTLTFLRAVILADQFEQLSQQPEADQAAVNDLRKVRNSLRGDRSPRYPDSAPAWWTREDSRLDSTSPVGGNQQQPQQGGGQRQPQQQQVPQQDGQQPQQQAPQHGGQQTVPQEGAEQPADSGQTEGQPDGDQSTGDGAVQPGQADGGAGEDGQGTGQSEDGAQQGADGTDTAPSDTER